MPEGHNHSSRSWCQARGQETESHNTLCGARRESVNGKDLVEGKRKIFRRPKVQDRSIHLDLTKHFLYAPVNVLYRVLFS